MAECVVVDFESCLSEVLSKLNETGMAFSLKKEQESAMRHIINGKDLMAVLPTGFGKSLIFQLFVMMCGVRSKRQGGTGFSSVIVISPLQSIIRDQVLEVMVNKIDRPNTTPTVRAICKFAVYFSVFRPFSRFSLVYEGHRRY